jgi:acetylornithine deacetylase/succinyl-diaminopimelate desuccinylase-like protein
MEVLDRVHDYIDQHWPQYLDDIRTFLRQPGISFTGEGIQESAEMLASCLRGLGASDVHLAEFGGHPIVYGELRSGRPTAKTLINYGMNDVMPTDEPGWVVPPFSAEIVRAEEVGADPALGDVIVCRGSYNQRGPLHAFLRALDAIKTTTGELPCDIIFCFEHEEEMGSVSMPKFRDAYFDRLSQADAVFYGRMAEDEIGRHIVYLGTKGMVKVELTVEGGDWGGPAQRDVHSSHDVWLDHPAWRLVWALNSLRDVNGRVAIEGFYDNYREPTPAEREMVRKLEESFDEDAVRRALGVVRFKRGLPGREMLAEYILGPVLNIDGLVAGWTGPDIKTIVPRRAVAKLDIRLVPNMTYEEIERKLRHHLAKRGFPEVQVRTSSSYAWYRGSAEDEINQAIIQACHHHEIEPALWPTHIAGFPGALFARPPLSLPMGTAGLGYGDQAHAVNEYITVEGLRDCIKYHATVLMRYAELT